LRVSSSRPPTQPPTLHPTPPSRQITAAEFTPDGALLATGSLDSSVILWEVATGRAVALFVGDAAVACLAWAAEPAPPGAAGAAQAPRPHTLIVGDAGGHVHFLCGLP
jgi:WD40 repeat protein